LSHGSKGKHYLESLVKKEAARKGRSPVLRREKPLLTGKGRKKVSRDLKDHGISKGRIAGGRRTSGLN